MSAEGGNEQLRNTAPDDDDVQQLAGLGTFPRAIAGLQGWRGEKAGRVIYIHTIRHCAPALAFSRKQTLCRPSPTMEEVTSFSTLCFYEDSHSIHEFAGCDCHSSLFP